MRGQEGAAEVDGPTRPELNATERSEILGLSDAIDLTLPETDAAGAGGDADPGKEGTGIRSGGVYSPGR